MNRTELLRQLRAGVQHDGSDFRISEANMLMVEAAAEMQRYIEAANNDGCPLNAPMISTGFWTIDEK